MIGDHREVILCHPRTFELGFYPSPGNPKWVGNNGKVCYATQLDADLAAEAISALPGADGVTAYPCPRGGHFHHINAERARRNAAMMIRSIAAAARRAGRS